MIFEIEWEKFINSLDSYSPEIYYIPLFSIHGSSEKYLLSKIIVKFSLYFASPGKGNIFVKG